MCWIFDSGKYIVFSGILQLIIYRKEKNAILFTYPPPVSFIWLSDDNFVRPPVERLCLKLLSTCPTNCIRIWYKKSLELTWLLKQVALGNRDQNP